METVGWLTGAMFLCIAFAAVALPGLVFDLLHRQRRYVLLSANRERALVMADYYNHAGGAER